MTAMDEQYYKREVAQLGHLVGNPLKAEQCIGQKTKRMADCKLSSRRSIALALLVLLLFLPSVL